MRQIVTVLFLVCQAACVATSQAPAAQTPSAPATTSVPKPSSELADAEKKLADWPQLGRYAAENAALPAHETGRVVFYGDSITDAWGRRPDTGPFFTGKPFVNRGISGQTTPQMVLRFRQDVVKLHPVAVVILAGTNNIAENTGPMTLEMTADNFRSMVEIARANGIRVVLASVLPASDFPWKKGLDPAPKVVAMNAWLKAYCAEQKLTYLDYYSAMAGPDGGMKPGISKDGVHPNTAGYAIMKPLALAALDAAMKK